MLPNTPRPHRIWAGALRGQRIFTSWRLLPSAILGRTEPALLTWFEENVRSGETWLDIGANHGYTTLALARLVTRQGRVFAFEPKLSTAGCLAETIRINDLPQTIAIPVALGEPETLALRRITAVQGMIDIREQAGDGIETILIARLDWLWAQICGKRPQIDGVKIDVQGMELEVLHGMKGLLQTYRPKLVVEMHDGIDLPSLLDLLETCGYQRQGKPVYCTPGETEPQYIDNHSYAFGLKA